MSGSGGRMRNSRVTKGDTFIVVTSDSARLLTSNNKMGSSAQDALQRGKACLGCRRRKMRCDGLRPICTQCSKRNRIDDCEYTDDAVGPTRTQILEETLARLQARVKELEKPVPLATPTPAVPLHDPYVPGTSSASSDVSMSSIFTDLTEIDSKPILDDSPRPTEGSLSDHSDPSQSSPTQDDAEYTWWELDEPPTSIASMLIRLFLPNSFQLGFALNVPRFLKALAELSSHPGYPHPGLMYAIYLWALRLSREPSLQTHENIYLRRAIDALQNVLGGALGDLNDSTFPTRVLHAMQAEVLVAQYFFTHGRILEGRYHANAAVSLAVSYGFHRISLLSYTTSSPPSQSAVSPSLGLLAQVFPPARSCIELGERINVFWSVYNIDRCWSVVGNPCIMSDDPAHGTQIDTPWPLDMQEYEMADMNTGGFAFRWCDRTIQRFLSREPPSEGINDSSFAALKVKAATLYERVSKLVMAWKASKPNSIARENVNRDMIDLADFLSTFTASLPAVENAEERVMSSDDRRTVYVVHTMTYSTVIMLHEVWAEADDGNQAESDICLEAAYQVARVPKAGVDVGLLDPVLGTAGMTLASLFAREIRRARKTPQTPETVERLKKMEDGMEYLKETAVRGKARPVYGLQVPKILAILDSVGKRM